MAENVTRSFDVFGYINGFRAARVILANYKESAWYN